MSIALYCFALSASCQTNQGPATLQTLIAADFKTNAVEEIKAVLKANPALVFATNASGQTPLFTFALGGNTNVVAALLACKAVVNATDNRGDTPLHKAASWGNKDVVALLLANRADVNARNNKGETPLSLAARMRSASYLHVSMEELLKESQTVTNSRAKDGTIIMRSKQDETIKLLFQHGGHE